MKNVVMMLLFVAIYAEVSANDSTSHHPIVEVKILANEVEKVPDSMAEEKSKQEWVEQFSRQAAGDSAVVIAAEKQEGGNLIVENEEMAIIRELLDDWKLDWEGYNSRLAEGDSSVINSMLVAEMEIAYLYVNALKDQVSALPWARRAAGHQIVSVDQSKKLYLAKAQTLQSLYYQEGWAGIERDAEKAVYWYRLAATNGDEQSQFNMGYAYENGEGVGQDYEQAVHWYSMAAQGNAGSQSVRNAMDNLARLFYKGQGTEKDLTKALYWWRKGAEAGYPKCYANVSVLYYMGEGTKKDYKEALVWAEAGDAKGDAMSTYLLGLYYNRGEGVKRDRTRAIPILHKAATMEYAPAYFALAEIYYGGEGTPRDFEQAALWCQRAIDEDVKNAPKLMKKIERKLNRAR